MSKIPPAPSATSAVWVEMFLNFFDYFLVDRNKKEKRWSISAESPARAESDPSAVLWAVALVLARAALAVWTLDAVRGPVAGYVRAGAVWFGLLTADAIQPLATVVSP